MKSAVETLDPTKVRLTVEVPFEELGPSLDAAYRKIAQQVTVPGFRKGKVPPRIIDQRFGRAVVLEEAVNDALPQFYGQAVRDNNVEALGQPEVEVTEFADGSDFKFTAEIEIRPEFELPDYQGIEVSVEDAVVTDEDVEERVNALRDRFASLSNVERPAAAGDFVTIDLVAAVDGVTPEDGTARNVSYEIGSKELLDGLDEAVTGLSAGESAEFASTLLGGEYAGQPAQVTVTVHAVKVKELPELDDEFAQSASEFDTVEELRADLRTRLESTRRGEQGSEAQQKVLDALLERVEVPLPDRLLSSEIEWRKENLEHQLSDVGLTLADYLQAEEKTQEEFSTDIEDTARRAIRTQFLLDAIVAREELSVSEAELSNHLVRRALSLGVAPDTFAQDIVQNGQVPVLVSEVVRNKALQSLVRAAKITDASGNAVDLSELLGDQEQEPSKPDAADADAADAGAEDSAEAPAQAPAESAAE